MQVTISEWQRYSSTPLTLEDAADVEKFITFTELNTLITARLAARAAKNWTESDRIRDELAAMGIQLKDGKRADGQTVTTWEVKR